jgi:hypothetical protein
MIILEAKQKTLDWNDFELVGRHGSHRFTHDGQLRPMRSSNAVHVTEILKFIFTELNMIKFIDQEDLDEAPLRMFLGMGWEYVIASMYEEMHWQPGELVVDGIVGSPDGKRVVEYNRINHGVISEMKFTSKSLRTFDLNDRKHALWVWQLKSYVAMTQQHLKNTVPRFALAYPVQAATGDQKFYSLAEFHVCFVSGDYKYPLTPVYGYYLVGFDVEELDRHWAMMVKYRDQVKNGGSE